MCAVLFFYVPRAVVGEVDNITTLGRRTTGMPGDFFRKVGGSWPCVCPPRGLPICGWTRDALPIGTVEREHGKKIRKNRWGAPPHDVTHTGRSVAGPLHFFLFCVRQRSFVRSLARSLTYSSGHASQVNSPKQRPTFHNRRATAHSAFAGPLPVDGHCKKRKAPKLTKRNAL